MATAVPSLLSASHPTTTAVPSLPSGGQLIMMSGGLSARLMLAPAGSTLPPGVRAVLVAPATAVPLTTSFWGPHRGMRPEAGAGVPLATFSRSRRGVRVGAGAGVPLATTFSGSRRGMRLVAGAGGADEAEPHHTAGDDDNDEGNLYKFVKAKAVDALGLLGKLAPPDHLLEEAAQIEKTLYGVIFEANAEEKHKVHTVLNLIGAAYSIIDITNKCLPSIGAPPPLFKMTVPSGSSPPEGKPFILLKDGSALPFDFGPGGDDTAAMMGSINMAMALATGATVYITTYRASQ